MEAHHIAQFERKGATRQSLTQTDLLLNMNSISKPPMGNAELATPSALQYDGYLGTEARRGYAVLEQKRIV